MVVKPNLYKSGKWLLVLSIVILMAACKENKQQDKPETPPAGETPMPDTLVHRENQVRYLILG